MTSITKNQHLENTPITRIHRVTTVIDVDLSRYFDSIRHHILLEKMAEHIQDPQVMHLIKQVIKVAGKIGVLQGDKAIIDLHNEVTHDPTLL